MNREHDHDGDHDHDHGRLIRWAARYDVVVALGLAGRGRRVRARLVELLAPRPGQRVLDVGCGTGTLALAVARSVAPDGVVVGVDASPEMVRRAQAKAGHRGLAVEFGEAAAQDLPFDDATFDAATCTLMLHHLPSADRLPALRELLRVLKPGGRLVVADFRPPSGELWGHLSRRLVGSAMAMSDLDAVRELASTAGLADVRLEGTPVPWLGVVHGAKP